MKKTAKAVLFFILTPSLLAAGEAEKVFKSAFSGMVSAVYSAGLTYADSGRKIFFVNENKNLVPASTLKLFVTAAALKILGPDYKFRTELAFTGSIKNGELDGDLIIRGLGDMTLGSANFNSSPEDFFEAVYGKMKEAGISSVRGGIICDSSLYDEEQPGSWEWRDIANYYAARFTAFSINDNSYKLIFKTSEKEGGKNKFLSYDPDTGYYLEDETSAGPADSGDNSYIYGLPWYEKIKVKGSLPAGKKEFTVKGSMGNPPLFAALALKKYLEKKGVKISGQASSGQAQGRNLAFFYSPELKDIVKVTNKKSFNFYAESLLRMLPYPSGAGFEKGMSVLKNFLAAAGVNIEDCSLADASGLSKENYLKASDFLKLLNWVYAAPYFNFFYDSMAYPGDGIAKGHIRAFGSGKKFSEKLRIKSGSLKGVRSYAGYFYSASGKPISFCFMVNNYAVSPAEIDKAVEKVLDAVYEAY